MKCLSIASFPALALLLLAGCAPIEELEQENSLLRRRIDSLEVLRESCNARLATLTQRISSLEQEKMSLEENARQMGRKLTEEGRLPVAVVEPSKTPTTVVAAAKAEPRSSEPSPSRSDPAASKNEPKPAAPVKDRDPAKDAPAAASRLPAVPPGGGTPPEQPSEKVEAPVGDDPAAVSGEPASDRYLSKYQEALTLFNRRNYARALQMFEALADTDPPNDMNDNAWYWKGECLFALRKYQEAVSAFSAVIGMRGADKQEAALMMRANTYKKLGRNAAAKEDYRRVVELFPNGEYRSRAQKQLRGMR
jgi:TolA-binding protein